MVVLPADKPATTPEVFTDPVAGAVLLQMPPAAASVSDVFAPTQTTGVPVIIPASGNPLTVTTCVAAAVPQLLVIV